MMKGAKQMIITCPICGAKYFYNNLLVKCVFCGAEIEEVEE